jgi:multidrug efflux pump subunit AcrA (membrane-fusion protein)
MLLERQYALQKLQSSIGAQRAALKLHGLTDEQIDTIVREQRLLRDLSIVAPEIDNHAHEENNLRLSNRRLMSASFQQADQPAPATEPVPLIVERLSASKGQGVQAGEMLCALSDYSTLYIEGKAFEQDAPAIAEVAAKGWPIEAIIPGVAGQETITELSLAFVASAVDPQSRTLSFFVNLPNTKLRDQKTPDGQRFVTWKYRVGQRLEVRVPVEAWEQQIVLPVDAAVKDGADWFVFQQNGDHFDRVPVHVKYRDQRYVVIENDGAIYPGDVIALRSAHQMQMAIKNKSGVECINQILAPSALAHYHCRAWASWDRHLADSANAHRCFPRLESTSRRDHDRSPRYGTRRSRNVDYLSDRDHDQWCQRC